MENPEEDPTIGETAFKALEISEMVFYSVVLVFAGYMIVKYFIYDDKHEITYLSAFYALTILLVVVKLCQFITYYRMTGEAYQEYICNISTQIGAQTKL